jgi:hypothetical protein
MRSHEWIDQRSLALDRAIAEKLRRDPSLLNKARQTVNLWLQNGSHPAWLEWKTILDTWPIERILDFLQDSTEEACRLRQSRPFCGILSESERWTIFQDYEPRQP